ncbi:tetratricopeptide repeat protein [Aquimarina sp. 2201CG5-10]|uniref:tetratricopeptide repeat protein n=1 Tax=Aquimarina callyspongiae TaxID=3098150 RepID=UPI002AB38ABD|nr:tetratricopeptide repeat protein [Aquimarina sp. 2201CG5-10]MDY8135853.1 tetratricopeptide repeat protein [Aquimarina sp. 2201CG5-10]
MFRKPFFWLVISLIVTFAFVSPNLSNDFLNWDDPAYVTQNELIKDFSIDGIVSIFSTKEVVSTYSPLVLLSWSFDYAISELDPLIFHLFNIIYHLCSVALVFYLVLLLTKRFEIAFIASVLFGIHPMHIEAVSWISARKDLLYTIFFLLSLIVYHFYTEKESKYPKWYYYIGCLLLYVLSLLSKGTAVILPLVLFLFDYLKRREHIKVILLEKLPFFLLSIWFVYISIDNQVTGGAMEDRKFISAIDSLSVGFYGYLTYLIKAILPFHLSPYHPYPNELGAPMPWYFYASAIPILALFIYTIIKVRVYRFLFFGISFFFITLIPVIQVLPFGSAVTADRYTYLPYFGLFFLLGKGIVHLIEKKTNLKKSIYLLLSVYLIFLGVITFQYSKTFKNTENLWSRVIELYPNDFLAYMNITNHKISQKDYKEALVYADKAINLKSNSYILYYNRGFVYETMGKNSLAIQDYSTSIQMFSKFYSAHANRGILYYRNKQYDLAIKDFKKSIEIAPKKPGGYYNLTMVYQQIGLFDKALQNVNQLIFLHFDLPKSLLTRGKILTNLNDPDKAIMDFTRAIELQPALLEAYLKRGNVYIGKGKFEMALNDFEKVIKIDANQVDAHINSGLILMNLARFKEALQSFEIALKLDQNNHLIYYNRGVLHHISGNHKAALSDFNYCIKIAPEFSPAIRDKQKLMNLFKNQ